MKAERVGLQKRLEPGTRVALQKLKAVLGNPGELAALWRPFLEDTDEVIPPAITAHMNRCLM